MTKLLCRLTASLGVLACVAAALYGVVRLCMILPPWPTPAWMQTACLIVFVIVALVVLGLSLFSVGSFCWDVGGDVCDRLNEWKRDGKGGR